MHELLEKYHLVNDAWDFNSSADDCCMMRVMLFKKANAKVKAIQSILRDFFVAPILNKGRSGGYLEVIGKQSECEIASFVAHFLTHKLDSLWLSAKNTTPSLKGIRDKNSFFLGIAQGYFLQKTKKPLKTERHKLMVIEKQISAMACSFYPHLRTTRGSSSVNKKAYQQGEKAGLGLSIAKGIKKAMLSPLITFKKSG